MTQDSEITPPQQEESSEAFTNRLENGMQLTTESLPRVVDEMQGKAASFIMTKEGLFIADRETTEHQNLYMNMGLAPQSLIDGGILVFLGDEMTLMQTSAYLDSMPELALRKNKQLEARPKITVPYLKALAGSKFTINSIQ